MFIGILIVLIVTWQSLNGYIVDPTVSSYSLLIVNLWDNPVSLNFVYVVKTCESKHVVVSRIWSITICSKRLFVTTEKIAMTWKSDQFELVPGNCFVKSSGLPWCIRIPAGRRSSNEAIVKRPNTSFVSVTLNMTLKHGGSIPKWCLSFTTRSSPVLPFTKEDWLNWMISTSLTDRKHPRWKIWRKSRFRYWKYKFCQIFGIPKFSSSFGVSALRYLSG